MKFSDVNREDWEANGSYWDTCLLPVTGLAGTESPWETTEALERLRDAMDRVEIPYKGRIVTYPAFHYYGENKGLSEALSEVCERLKQAHFRFVILISADLAADKLTVPQADLALTPERLEDGGYKTDIARIWSSAPVGM